MSGLISCRPINDAEAGRLVGLIWRGTDPRGADFRLLAQSLRIGAPDGVAVMAA
jgi:LysR family hydrogen peroxide-inducible transcriptional activator